MGFSRSQLAAVTAAFVFLAGLYWCSSPCQNTQTAEVSLQEYLRAGMRETEHYRFAEGLRWLEAAQKLAPESGDVYIALGKHFYRRQDYVRAIDQFVLAARFAPGNTDVLYYAGLLRSRLTNARPQGAMLFFERAYQVDADNYPAMREWVRLVAQTEGKANAVAIVNYRLRSEPRNANLWWVLGEAHAASGDAKTAIRHFQHALTINAKLAPAKLALADALKATGHPDSAVSQYWLGAMIDAKYTDGLFMAAQTLMEMKDFVQADSMAHYLMQIAPDYPGVYHLLSDIYNAGDRHDLAVDAMAQEVAHHPENISAKVDLADAHISMGHFDQAITVLKEVTNQPVDSIREPRYVTDWVRGHIVLSKAFRGLKRYDAAEEAARIASNIDSHSLYIKREMAYVKAGLDFGN